MACNRNKSKVKSRREMQTCPWQHTNCCSCSGPGDDRCCGQYSYETGIQYSLSQGKMRGERGTVLYLQPQQPHFRHPNLLGVKRKPKFRFVTNSITDHVVRVKRRNRRV